VSVQIRTLGHVVKEGVKGERSLLMGVLEGSCRVGFTILGGGLRLSEGGRRQANEDCGSGQVNCGTATEHKLEREPASFKLWTASVQCTTRDLPGQRFCVLRVDCYTGVCCLCAVADLAGPSA